MDIDRIHYYLDNSATIKLLKSEYATLAVGFFFHAFKANYKTQLYETEILLMLQEYLQSDEESQQKFKGKMTLLQFSERLLNLWCDDKHRFLRKYYDFESDTPLVELTYDTERALVWMESLDKKEFVGTHSRFFMIYENIKKLREETQKDPAIRLKYLEEKRKEVVQEMNEIKATGKCLLMDETHIKERFFNLIEDSRKLISEFGLVEEIFKNLAQQIKEKKLIEFANKGMILGEILDTYDSLEKSDQGKSFNAFWDFLMSSDDDEYSLNEMIHDVLNADEIKFILTQHPAHGNQLKKLKSNLLQVGKKVLQSKIRLSEELRKLLHQQSLKENKLVMDEIAQIKKIFIENKSFFIDISAKNFITIPFLPEIYLPMERPLWSASAAISFNLEPLKYGVQNFSTDEIDELRSSFYVDRKEVEKRISDLLLKKDQVFLKDIIAINPVKKGVTEVLMYFEVAQANYFYMINEEINDVFSFMTETGGGKMTVPQLIFISGKV